MMSPQDERAESGFALTKKIFLSSAIGLLTFGGSALLDGPVDVPLPDQLLLTTIVGGIAFLAQFLVDFEARLYSLEEQQRLNVLDARKIIDRGFARISEATRLFTLLENSALPTTSLTQLMQRSSGINGSSAPLIRELAGHEVERVSSFLRSLSGGTEVFYDGEDREWLLGLAQRAQVSISATSLATIDAGGSGFEGGIWKNDLGGRYLTLQRDAAARGVQIRRIFVFDKPEFAVDPDFATIRRLQQDAGVRVRVLENSMVPEHLKSMISDFIVFDGVICYETTPATRMDGRVKPAILTTRLILEDERVRGREARFEELWAVAQELD
jgi:hypothetical protein